MKNKCLKLAGVAMTAAAFAGSAYATPIGTLTLSDNNGNTTSVATDASGSALFDGALGNWSINVTSGVENGDTAQPVLTLSSFDADFSGSTVGDILTITFTYAPVGPLTGSFLNNATVNSSLGGTPAFDVLLNGSPASVPSGISSGATTTGVTSIGIETVLSALAGPEGGGIGSANFTDTLSDPSGSTVPDGGTTVLLLGAALSVMGLFRKKLIV